MSNLYPLASLNYLQSMLKRKIYHFIAERRPNLMVLHKRIKAFKNTIHIYAHSYYRGLHAEATFGKQFLFL